MSVSVCEQAPARQAKSHSTGARLSAFSLVTGTVIPGVPGHSVTWIAVLILVLVVVVVVPAVWSAKGYRRKAGLDVLDHLLPWNW